MAGSPWDDRSNNVDMMLSAVAQQSFFYVLSTLPYVGRTGIKFEGFSFF